MNIAEYSRMAEREQAYWWHVGRLAIIDAWLKRWVKPRKKAKILNIGCGTGGTLPVLEKYGSVENVDVSSEAIKFMGKSGYHVTRVKDHLLPYKDNTFDLLVAFDVLEHIKEHEAALLEWSRVLKKNGAILLTVPAYQWLWSGHDVSLHHHRRYTLQMLRNITPKILSIKRSSYCIIFSLPLIIGFRFLYKISGKKSDSETSYVNLPRPVNSFFSLILKGEAKAHTLLRFPAGTSLIVYMKKH